MRVSIILSISSLPSMLRSAAITDSLAAGFGVGAGVGSARTTGATAAGCTGGVVTASFGKSATSFLALLPGSLQLTMGLLAEGSGGCGSTKLARENSVFVSIGLGAVHL